MGKSADQEIIIGIIAGSIMFILLGVFILSFIFFYKKRKQLYLKETELMKSSFQQELLRTQLEIQEQTLKNISQEIHDNIGQTLSLAKLNLNTVNPKQQNRMDEKISASKELLSKAIQDLRSLSRTLNTDTILASGLLKAIEYELQILKAEFETELKVAGNPIKIDPQKELILFRIVQEALNNIINHSQANKITIATIYEDQTLNLSIIDNGQGFDTVWKNDGGSGLHNMRSRAELIGGTLEIESSTASGTQIQITVPIQQHESNNSIS